MRSSPLAFPQTTTAGLASMALSSFSSSSGVATSNFGCKDISFLCLFIWTCQGPTTSSHLMNRRRWFSGKICRCHRQAPGSIPGRRMLSFIFCAISHFYFLLFARAMLAISINWHVPVIYSSSFWNPVLCFYIRYLFTRLARLLAIISCFLYDCGLYTLYTKNKPDSIPRHAAYLRCTGMLSPAAVGAVAGNLNGGAASLYSPAAPHPLPVQFSILDFKNYFIRDGYLQQNVADSVVLIMKWMANLTNWTLIPQCLCCSNERNV